MIAIEDDFVITKQIGVVHDAEGFQAAREKYLDRVVFAKYLSISDIAKYNVKPVLEEISRLRDQGFSLAKSWFGPRWRDYHEVLEITEITAKVDQNLASAFAEYIDTISPKRGREDIVTPNKAIYIMRREPDNSWKAVDVIWNRTPKEE